MYETDTTDYFKPFYIRNDGNKNISSYTLNQTAPIASGVSGMRGSPKTHVLFVEQQAESGSTGSRQTQDT